MNSRVPAKRWLEPPAVDRELAGRLAGQLQVPVLAAELLIQRGYDTLEKASRFLTVTPYDLYDPYLMKDMDKAVRRIRQAVDTAEPIVVYGDYDVDGVTSTALLWLGLKELGANVQTYIPDRFEEGYGLNQAALLKLQDRCSLLITVDNGIAAAKEVAYAADLGLDVIVTDHHNPPAELPPALAVLNPKQPGCEYPDSMLAGVGIAFKLVQALWERIPEELSDLAALGTVADLAPLVNENRILVRMGLARLNQFRRPGIQALCEKAGLFDKPLTAGHIGFQLGPRINASGRLHSALSALDLLIQREADACAELADALDAYNTERQQLCDKILQEAVALLDEDPHLADDPILVVSKAGWNTGIVGIVAARLVEKYYRPVILLSEMEDGMAKGSARSINGVDIYSALADSAHLFHHFGGHKMAAGLSLALPSILQLRTRLREWARCHVKQETWIPEVRIDRVIHASDLTEETVQAVEQLGPFGFGNPQPVFALREVTPSVLKTVGRDQAHLQLQGIQDGISFQAVGFRMGEAHRELSQLSLVDLAGDLSVSTWQGAKRVQFVLKDIRPSSLQMHLAGNVQQQESWIEARTQGERSVIVCFAAERLESIRRALTSYPWQQTGNCLFLHIPEDDLNFQELEASLRAQAAEVWVVSGLPVTAAQWKCLRRLLPEQGATYWIAEPAEVTAASERIKGLLPERHLFASVYRTLQTAGRSLQIAELQQCLPQMDEKELRLILTVFLELDLVTEVSGNWQAAPHPVKRQLSESGLYQQTYEDVKELLGLCSRINSSASSLERNGEQAKWTINR